MQRLINFIVKRKTFLLYILLLFIAVLLTIQTHSYHRSKFFNSSNRISGSLHNFSSNISKYFNLKEQNTLLIQENKTLKQLLYNKEGLSTSNAIFHFKNAKIIKNSYTISNNILLINKGIKDSVKIDQGVIGAKGIIGIIEHVGNNYSTVISILNKKFSTSGQLKHSHHFGSIKWNGKNEQFVSLIDLPKIAPIKTGDTIITSGRSSIFPKHIPIGVVKNYTLDSTQDSYIATIELIEDMTNLEHAYLIENKHKKEIDSLLNNVF